MNKKKEKFFGIGVVVLLVLMSVTPLVLSQPTVTKTQTIDKEESIDVEVTEGECPICSHAKSNVLFLSKNPQPLSMFGKIWGLIFGSNPVSCITGCALELGILSITVVICLILAAGAILSGGAGAIAAIAECTQMAGSAVVFYNCFTSCMDA